MEQREQSEGKGHPEGDWRECPLAGDVFVSGSVAFWARMDQSETSHLWQCFSEMSMKIPIVTFWEA